MLNRDTLLGLGRAFKDVEVPQTGDTVRIQAMSAAARDAAFDGTQLSGSDTYVRLIIATAVDQAGNPLFTADDVDALKALPAGVVDQLGEAAAELSGIGRRAQEDLAKNSDAAQSGDSPSDSQAT